MLDIHSLARALGGTICGRDSVVCPGPGHSRADRSLSVKIAPDNPDGFVVYSHAGDDPIVCKNYVRERLGLPSWRPSERERLPIRRHAPMPDIERHAQHMRFAAALERLEEERKRRVNEKIEAGLAVRVPLLATATQNLADRMADKMAELRAAGEGREVVFDPLIVATGVPRGEPISTGKADSDPLVKSRYEKPVPLPARPARAVPDMTEAKKITATIAPIRDERDFGTVIFGSYKVEGGQVHVADDKGRHLTSTPVGCDDDVEMVARRLLRQKLTGANGFDGPLSLPKRSIV